MSDYIKSTRIIENTWTCTSCQEKNLGRYMKCQKCGSNKEFDEQDELPEDTANAPTVTDSEQLKQANAGEDWMCEYCMGRVRNSDGDCHNCAAKRDPDNSKMQEPVKLDDDWRVKTSGQGKALPNLSNRKLPEVVRPKWPYAALGGGLVVVGLLVWALIPRHVFGTVTNTEWTYTTIAYKRQLNHGNGWGTPSGAFNTSCQTRYKGTVACHPHDCRPHQVSYSCNSRTYQCNPRQQSYDCNCTSRECNCHESCRSNKNGYSTCTTRCSTCRSCSTCYRTVYSTCEKHDTCYRTEYDTCYDQCPVYDNWCEYDYYTWPEFKRSNNTGNGTDPLFPDFVAPDQETYKTEHVERYVVTFLVEKTQERLTYNPKTLEEYRKFSSGQTWEIKKGLFGMEVVPKP